MSDIIITDDEEIAAVKWKPWRRLDYTERHTTAIIKCRESEELFTGIITAQKGGGGGYSMMGYSDDDDYGPIEYVEQQCTFRKIDVIVIPQIGLNAGIIKRKTYFGPNKSDYQIENQCMMLNDIMRDIHNVQYSQSKDNIDVIEISQFNPKYIKMPSILNNKSLPEFKLNFFGNNNIFTESVVIKCIDNMSFDEINSLILTALFAKYGFKTIPKFIWRYKQNGMPSENDMHKIKYYGHGLKFNNKRKKEFDITFDGFPKNNFGLKRNIGKIEKYLILNIVGYGLKTIYFDTFTDYKFKDLINEFYKFTKKINFNDKYQCNLLVEGYLHYLEKKIIHKIIPSSIMSLCFDFCFNSNSDIIAIYPHNNYCVDHIFLPNTSQRDFEYDRSTRNKSKKEKIKVFPEKQNKKFITFDYEKYKSIWNKSLFDLKLNKNGNIIEMYHVTGPCIKVMFCSMVGDSRFLDINMYWTIHQFKMYAAQFTGVGMRGMTNPNFQIENVTQFGAKNENVVSLYDVCKHFKKQTKISSREDDVLRLRYR